MTIFDIIVIILFITVVSIIIWFNIGCYPKGTFIRIQQSSNGTKDVINEMKFPNDGNIVGYGDYIYNGPIQENNNKNVITNINNGDPTIDQRAQDVSNVPLKYSNRCANKSANEVDKCGTGYLQPNKESNQCLPNADTNNNFEIERLGIEDPAKYYQIMYARMPLNFDDGGFAGYNHFTFPGFGGIKNIGQIPLQKTSDYPIGVNN